MNPLKWIHLKLGATAFVFAFLASFPSFCVSGSNGTTETRCQAALVGVTLPGYSGTGDDFSASLWPPVAIGLFASAIVFLIARMAWRSD